jgi:hypothetical protein
MRKDGVQRQFGVHNKAGKLLAFRVKQPSVSVWACPSDLYNKIERFQARDYFREIYDRTFPGILISKSRTPNSAEC